MFTGLIREIGIVRVVNRQSGGAEFTVHAPKIASEIAPGDSVAVNGVCTTITSVHSDDFQFTAAPETLKKTTLSTWRTNTKVNLERPLKVGDSLDGHWVLGHVDGTVKIKKIHPRGDSILLTVELTKELSPYVVPRGSIALDGVSLTVAQLEGLAVTVSLVPHTLQETNFGDRRAGDQVNIETDILGKHVVQFLQGDRKKSEITLDFLKKQGYI